MSPFSYIRYSRINRSLVTPKKGLIDLHLKSGLNHTWENTVIKSNWKKKTFSQRGKQPITTKIFCLKAWRDITGFFWEVFDFWFAKMYPKIEFWPFYWVLAWKKLSFSAVKIEFSSEIPFSSCKIVGKIHSIWDTTIPSCV